MSDIDFYIMQFEPEVQRRLMEIRFTAFDTFKGAEERIYHGIPTFMINGEDILNMGRTKIILLCI